MLLESPREWLQLVNMARCSSTQSIILRTSRRAMARITNLVEKVSYVLPEKIGLEGAFRVESCLKRLANLDPQDPKC